MNNSVSIVVNNHDYGRFLGAAVDSALAQTHGAVQVIVVDDGSSDDSRDVIASYGPDVDAVLKPNGGQGSAYNAGFAAARGDLVVFLDADDVLLPEAAARAAEAMRSPVVKVSWPMLHVDERGTCVGGLIPDRRLPEGDLSADVLRLGPDSYLSAPGSGNAWSRQLLDRALPVPEAPYRRGADGYLITVAPLYGEVAAIQEPLGLYRIHGANGFWKRTARERTRGSLERYERRFRSLDDHRRRLEIDADIDRWRDRNPYVSWLRQLDDTLQLIESLVPAGASFVIIDGDQLGLDLVEGRTARPLLPDGGEPADDDAAVAALDRRLAGGAEWVVVAWTAAWWLDHYVAFAQRLHAIADRVVTTPTVTAFQVGSHG